MKQLSRISLIEDKKISTKINIIYSVIISILLAIIIALALDIGKDEQKTNIFTVSENSERETQMITLLKSKNLDNHSDDILGDFIVGNKLNK